jgi:hypothetical protein
MAPFVFLFGFFDITSIPQGNPQIYRHDNAHYVMATHMCAAYIDDSQGYTRNQQPLEQ